MLWKFAVTFFFAIDTFLVLLTNLDIVFCKSMRVFNYFFLFCSLRYLHVIRKILILFYHSLSCPVFVGCLCIVEHFFTHNSHYAVALIYKGGEVDRIRNKQKQYPLNVLTWVRRISSFVCCWLSCGRKSSEGAPSLGVGLFSPRSIELFAKLTKLCKFFAEAHQAKTCFRNHIISIEIRQFSEVFYFFCLCVH
jgi:hypothetical protein